MKLNKLLENLAKYDIFGDLDIEIQGIADDSRKVKKGDLFVAIKGNKSDGHVFIEQAIEAGAVAVVGEKAIDELSQITYIKVDNSRIALSILAQNWHGNPAKKLEIIVVTGTDGKTTTASMIYHILLGSGVNVGVITTVEARVGKKHVSTGLHVTNPEPLVLQKMLADFVKHGVTHAVIEVTSHGISQSRVYGIPVDVAVLTNITPEHLDYHKTMSSYAATKFKLFENAKESVINIDDKKGREFVKKLSNVTTYGFSQDADLQGKVLGDELIVSYCGKEYWQKLKLGGQYNYQNALGAIAAVSNFKVSVADALTSLKSFKFPEGRLQKISNKKGLEIYVDYAHTPNAVEKLIGWAKGRTRKSLLCLVSAEGERDPAKRGKIGEIAAKHCDLVVLNPIDTRSESPKTIGRQMVAGVFEKSKKNYKLILDRGEAIKYLLSKAKKGDLVLVLGKGHEESINLGDGEYRWSDKEAVKMALSGKTYKIYEKISN